MNRSISILCFLILMALFFVSILTDIIREPEIFGTGAIIRVSIHFVSTFLLSLGGIAYCGFALLHAAQRIADPRDRIGWIFFIIPLTVLGSLFYYLTKYQRFREIGKGSLILEPKKARFSGFLQLSEEEKQSPVLK